MYIGYGLSLFHRCKYTLISHKVKLAPRTVPKAQNRTVDIHFKLFAHKIIPFTACDDQFGLMALCEGQHSCGVVAFATE